MSLLAVDESPLQNRNGLLGESNSCMKRLSRGNRISSLGVVALLSPFIWNSASDGNRQMTFDMISYTPQSWLWMIGNLPSTISLPF